MPAMAPLPAAIVEKIAIADGAADLVAGRVEAGDHPGLVVAGAGEDGDRDGDDGDTEPEPGDEHAREDVSDVAAVLADVGQKSHPGGGDQERCGERAANAVLARDVTGRVGADACRQGERDEGEASRERPHAEHVLEIQRAEQEEAEDRTGCGEHQEEAAADRAIDEPLDTEQRGLGAALEDREGERALRVRRGRSGASGWKSSQRSRPG